MTHETNGNTPANEPERQPTVVMTNPQAIHSPQPLVEKTTSTVGASGPSHFAPIEEKGHRKAPFIVLGVLVFLLVAIYFGGVWAFHNICYPNTLIADVDVSLMRRDTARQRIEAAAENYDLTVSGEGFSWTFTPESSESVIDAEGALEHVLAANEPWVWPYRLYNALTNKNTGASDSQQISEINIEDIELPSTFDRETFLAELAAAIEAYNAERPGTFDAAGAYDAEAGAFTLAKARSSQKLDAEVVQKAALLAISQLNESIELNEDSYVALANGATDKELQAAIDAANQLIGTNVDLNMGGTTVATLDGATLATWMTFDDQLNPTLNTDMVTTWVRELAQTTLDTAGTSRTYTRADGKQINIDGGTYGWICDEAALIQLLQDAVANKQTGAIDVPTKQTADTYAGFGQRDWGAYIDIDLSEQYARYYDASGNIIWESHIISGNPNTDHSTPTGIYRMNQKLPGITLVGADENKDGEPDYKTPVAYWMPFVGGAVGLHDADWQSSAAFADPSAYTYRGSHGCVNLPVDKAAELYGMVDTGLCVITHY